MDNEGDVYRFNMHHLLEIIATLGNTVRSLSLSALDLQALALSKKHQIEKAVDNVDDLNDIMEQLIAFLEQQINIYCVESAKSAKAAAKTDS